MTADDIAAYDPALKGRFGYGVLCQDHGLISDPGAYVAVLAEHFQSEGGEVLTGEVVDFETQDKRVIAVNTDQGRIAADQILITTGAWSTPFAKQFGVQVPLESERGYHIEFLDPSITLKSPIMVSAGKFVVSSMEGRLRCAGVVEFGGLDAGPSKPPFDLLRRQAAQLFPDLTYSDTLEWMGHRPATPDSVPVIGQAPRAENVYLGYGHQHIGLTGGPKTGRWLAQMITGQPVNTDLSAFSPARQA